MSPDLCCDWSLINKHPSAELIKVSRFSESDNKVRQIFLTIRKLVICFAVKKSWPIRTNLYGAQDRIQYLSCSCQRGSALPFLAIYLTVMKHLITGNQ